MSNHRNAYAFANWIAERTHALNPEKRQALCALWIERAIAWHLADTLDRIDRSDLARLCRKTRAQSGPLANREAQKTVERVLDQLHDEREIQQTELGTSLLTACLGLTTLLTEYPTPEECASNITETSATTVISAACLYCGEDEREMQVADVERAVSASATTTSQN